MPSRMKTEMLALSAGDATVFDVFAVTLPHKTVCGGKNHLCNPIRDLNFIFIVKIGKNNLKESFTYQTNY